MYDSLTRIERACLRLAHHDRKAEQIGFELGIKASTVNTHIFSARRKLGGISRLSAADQLRGYEAASVVTDVEQLEQTADDCERRVTPVSPLPQQPVPKQTLRMAQTPAIAQQRGHPADVREHRTAFVFEHESGSAPGGKDGSGTETLRRIRLILAIAVLAALVAIAAPAIYDSAAERIANSLERPHLR